MQDHASNKQSVQEVIHSKTHAFVNQPELSVECSLALRMLSDSLYEANFGGGEIMQAGPGDLRGCQRPMFFWPNIATGATVAEVLRGQVQRMGNELPPGSSYIHRLSPSVLTSAMRVLEQLCWLLFRGRFD